jgi:hypothetical protein
MLLDQAVREARAGGSSAQGSLLHTAGKEALIRYLNGGRVVFQVDRAADILGALRFAQHDGIKAVIAGGDEAWMVAKELVKANVPVIMDPPRYLLGSVVERTMRPRHQARTS